MQVPADTRLAVELTDDDVVEMANLTTAQTGVPGTIFISTAMGGHGPRVKYFLQPGRSQPSFSSCRRKLSTGSRATRTHCSFSGAMATPGLSLK